MPDVGGHIYTPSQCGAVMCLYLCIYYLTFILHYMLRKIEDCSEKQLEKGINSFTIILNN